MTKSKGICCCSTFHFTQATAGCQIVLHSMTAVVTTVALALANSPNFEGSTMFAVNTGIITVPFNLIKYIVVAVTAPQGYETLDFREDGHYCYTLTLELLSKVPVCISIMVVVLLFQMLAVFMSLVLFQGTIKKDSTYLTAWLVYAVHFLVLTLLEVGITGCVGLVQIAITSFVMWVVNSMQQEIRAQVDEKGYTVGLRQRSKRLKIIKGFVTTQQDLFF